MQTMHAVALTHGLPIDDEQSLIDVELPVPEPGSRDVLIEVLAASVNPVDVKQRSGSPELDAPRVLGFDGAGIVRAVGADVTLFAPGDEVWWAGQLDRQGSDADLQLVDERIAGRKPTSLGFASAAALPLTTITAWEALFDKLRLTSADAGTLLVVGATGGVGSVLLQLVRELLPSVRTVATASGAENEAWVRDLGASEVVDHHADLVAQVRRIAPEGVDWIFSAHSAGRAADYAALLRPFGAIVAIDSGRDVDFDLLKSKSLSWHWEYMFTRPVQRSSDMITQHEVLDAVATLVDEHRVVSTATTVLRGWDAATFREAHRLVESGHTVGKVVVER
ncbi:zinc-binding alcohol dehydrogenase family protein [Humibacter sp. RRB41]|uniref:zinc-binding alcohol dehydrogenase family protein n=1 Tax=Humibacter sp. RRB41 TaxID=2919946 RepID=UPI001FAB34DF|nr:zinc-binding alcohol dehydrogenase family protein [Humibacter sp. RRB41]